MTNPTVGIFLKLFNISLFTAISLLFKSVAGPFGTPEMCFMVMVFAALFILPASLKIGVSMRSPISLYLIRAFTNALGISTWVYSISKIGANESTAISYIIPIITSILGVVLCKERLNYKYILATLTGFFGVYITSKPIQDLDLIGGCCILISCFSWAFHDITCKKQSGYGEHAVVQALHSFWMGALFLAPVALFSGRFGTELSDYSILVVVAILSALNVSVIFLAYKFAPITLLMPFSYCRFPIMCIATYFLYGKIPTSESVIGSCIIICSSIFVFSQRKKGS